ncbi:hypothetical protein FOA52_010227, partial [Chlamydomonas sp. UWO 241]
DDAKPAPCAPRQFGGKWFWIGLAIVLAAIEVIVVLTTIILTREPGSDNVSLAGQAETVARLSGDGVQVVLTIRANGTASEVFTDGDGYCTQLLSEGLVTSCAMTVESAGSRRRLHQSSAYDIVISGDISAGTRDAAVGSVAAILKFLSDRGIVGVVTVQCARNGYVVDAICSLCSSCTAGQFNSGTACSGTGTANTVVCEACGTCANGQFNSGTACTRTGTDNTVVCEDCVATCPAGAGPSTTAVK